MLGFGDAMRRLSLGGGFHSRSSSGARPMLPRRVTSQSEHDSSQKYQESSQDSSSSVKNPSNQHCQDFQHILSEPIQAANRQNLTEPRQSDEFNIFAPRSKKNGKSIIQLTSRAQTSQAVCLSPSNLRAPSGLTSRQPHAPKLKHLQLPHELIEQNVKSSCFYSSEPNQVNLSASMLQSDRRASQDFLIEQCLGNKRAFAFRGSADSRRQMININDINLEEQKHQRE